VARTPEGPPPPPAVQRLQLRYAKRGRLRFSSHRDFQRAFERALRRAEVPMAFSAGFSPHPKISYANAAPTGAASEAEYVEISVTHPCDPERVRAALDEALPPGLDILQVIDAGGEAKGSLVERLEASEWRLQLPGVPSLEAEKAVAAFLGRDEVVVERLTKTGIRSFDARSAVVLLEATPGAPDEADGTPCAILRLVVHHRTPAVRPDDVLSALRLVADLAPPVPPLVTRLAQGPLDAVSGTVADPLAPLRS
jgi:radical SAM-linked protein